MTRLFTKSEAAHLAGVSFSVLKYHIRKGYCADASLFWGRNNCLFTDAEVAVLKEHFSKSIGEFKKTELKKRKLYSTAEIAAKFKVAPETLYRMIREGIIPAPTRSATDLSRHKRYAEEDLKGIRKVMKAFHAKPSATRKRDQLMKQGYFSALSAAEELGIPAVTLKSWLKNGTVEKPSTVVEGERHPVYTRNDLKAIRKKKARYFALREKK